MEIMANVQIIFPKQFESKSNSSSMMATKSSDAHDSYMVLNLFNLFELNASILCGMHRPSESPLG